MITPDYPRVTYELARKVALQTLYDNPDYSATPTNTQYNPDYMNELLTEFDGELFICILQSEKHATRPHLLEWSAELNPGDKLPFAVTRGEVRIKAEAESEWRFSTPVASEQIARWRDGGTRYRKTKQYHSVNGGVMDFLGAKAQIQLGRYERPDDEPTDETLLVTPAWCLPYLAAAVASKLAATDDDQPTVAAREWQYYLDGKQAIMGGGGETAPVKWQPPAN